VAAVFDDKHKQKRSAKISRCVSVSTCSIYCGLRSVLHMLSCPVELAESLPRPDYTALEQI